MKKANQIKTSRNMELMGRVLICPSCQSENRVYHVAWEDITCRKCYECNEKKEWLVKDDTQERFVKDDEKEVDLEQALTEITIKELGTFTDIVASKDELTRECIAYARHLWLQNENEKPDQFNIQKHEIDSIIYWHCEFCSYEDWEHCIMWCSGDEAVNIFHTLDFDGCIDWNEEWTMKS